MTSGTAVKRKAPAKKRSATAAKQSAKSVATKAASDATVIIRTLAGISSAAVAKATGHGWNYWLRVLDKAGAGKLPHPEIVKLLSKSLGVRSPWWLQMITAGRRDRAGAAGGFGGGGYHEEFVGVDTRSTEGDVGGQALIKSPPKQNEAAQH